MTKEILPPYAHYTRIARGKGATPAVFPKNMKWIMEERPNLTVYGMDFLTGAPGSERRKEFERCRKDLLSAISEEAFWACCEFIQTLHRTQNPRINECSGFWKHAVEKWTQRNGHPTYIPEGVFIAAGFYLGLRARETDGLGVFFNISNRNLKRFKL